MANWQIIVALLVAAWILQGIGTYVQMGRYRRVLGELARAHPEGWMGAGNAKGSFAKGVIAIILVTPDAVVRRALVMEGRSVFARFQRLPELEGLTIDALEAYDHGAKARGRGKAFAMAVEQIRRVQAGNGKAVGPAAEGRLATAGA